MNDQKDRRIGKDLIEAIGKMETSNEWAIVIFLLELAQFRLQASIKSEIDAAAQKKAAA